MYWSNSNANDNDTCIGQIVMQIIKTHVGQIVMLMIMRHVG